MSLDSFIASKPDGAFLMLGVNADWCTRFAQAMHPLTKLLVVAETLSALGPVAHLPAQDIRTAIHVQDYAGFISDVTAQRFVGIVLADELSTDSLLALLPCLLPGGFLACATQDPRSLAPNNVWQKLCAPDSTLYVKGPEVRKRGAVRRAVRQRAAQ